MPDVQATNAATKNEIVTVSKEHGLVVVTGATSTQRFEFAADGTNERAQYVAALDAWAADLPGTIDFGPGDYGISGGYIPTIVQGSRGLTVRGVPGATRIRFTGGSAAPAGQEIALKIQPSVTPTAGVYADYLQDVTVTGLAFYDDNPAIHSAGSDETHGLDIRYGVNVTIDNCSAVDIGDEAFNITDTKGGRITNNQTINTPSEGTSGGPISVQAGCTDIVITGNRLFGSSTIGTQGTTTTANGIQVANIAARSITGVTITGNTIRDFSGAGTTVNSSAASITHVDVTNNLIDNCDQGFLRQGGSFLLQHLKVVGNTITNSQDVGVKIDVSAANTQDVFVCDNIIADSTVRSMTFAVTRATVSNNHFTGDPQCILVNTGSAEINITGGLMYQCGGANLEEVEAISSTDIAMNGVSIIDSQATIGSTKGVQDVKNCVMKRGVEGVQTDSTVITQPSNGIRDCINAVGNTLVNYGIRPLSTATNGVIANNRIYLNTDASSSSLHDSINLAAGNTGYSIIGNNIDTTDCLNNQVCVRTNASATGGIIDGNRLDASTDSLVDSATSTLGTNITV